MADREERLARNEALFREVNERVRKLGGAGADDEITIVCECGREHCIEQVRLTPAQYEEVRSDPTQFALVPGHEAPHVERMVLERENYVVVKKTEEEARIAIETDPRRRG